MALHCAATLALVPAGSATEGVGGRGAVVVGALLPQADAVEELQSLADQHRGERVVVPVTEAHLAAVLEHLGRAAGHGRQDGEGGIVWLEVGDDGWVLTPPRE